MDPVSHPKYQSVGSGAQNNGCCGAFWGTISIPWECARHSTGGCFEPGFLGELPVLFPEIGAAKTEAPFPGKLLFWGGCSQSSSERSHLQTLQIFLAADALQNDTLGMSTKSAGKRMWVKPQTPRFLDYVWWMDTRGYFSATSCRSCSSSVLRVDRVWYPRSKSCGPGEWWKPWWQKGGFSSK